MTSLKGGGADDDRQPTRSLQVILGRNYCRFLSVK